MSFTFTPSGNFNGFYIGIRDTGTCVNIQRIQVYYRASPSRTDGLVMYPEITLPALSSNAAVTGIVTCCQFPQFDKPAGHVLRMEGVPVIQDTNI